MEILNIFRNKFYLNCTSNVYPYYYVYSMLVIIYWSYFSIILSILYIVSFRVYYRNRRRNVKNYIGRL